MPLNSFWYYSRSWNILMSIIRRAVLNISSAPARPCTLGLCRSNSIFFSSSSHSFSAFTCLFLKADLVSETYYFKLGSSVIPGKATLAFTCAATSPSSASLLKTLSNSYWTSASEASSFKACSLSLLLDNYRKKSSWLSMTKASALLFASLALN